MELAKAAIAAGIVLAVLDALWLGVIAKNFLVQQLGDKLRQPLNWPPGLAFYALYSVALGFFAVSPAMAAGGDWLMALGLGGFLGLVAYGTYDLTNWATLKGWPPLFAIVDIAWGAAVSAMSSAGGVLLIKITGVW
jgi:uncharacterized membrane protein